MNSVPFRLNWNQLSNTEISVKSLSRLLSQSSPLQKVEFTEIWKTNSPKRIKVLIWQFGKPKVQNSLIFLLKFHLLYLFPQINIKNRA